MYGLCLVQLNVAEKQNATSPEPIPHLSLASARLHSVSLDDREWL